MLTRENYIGAGKLCSINCLRSDILYGLKDFIIDTDLLHEKIIVVWVVILLIYTLYRSQYTWVNIVVNRTLTNNLFEPVASLAVHFGLYIVDFIN